MKIVKMLLFPAVLSLALATFAQTKAPAKASSKKAAASSKVSDKTASDKKSTSGVLSADELKALIPSSFFYAGQTAPVQARNSGGFRSTAGKLAIASLVDNSGYSTGVAEKYAGFFATDGSVKIGGKELKPGAYGIGALDDGSFVVTDLGANNVFTTPYTNDKDLKRPMPLKFVAESGKDSFRLYLGRKYVTVSF